MSYTSKVRILDLCGRVIWSGTGAEYTRAVMEKRFADKVVLINNIDNLKKTIPLLHMY
jgi:hypothetical protein